MKRHAKQFVPPEYDFRTNAHEKTCQTIKETESIIVLSPERRRKYNHTLPNPNRSKWTYSSPVVIELEGKKARQDQDRNRHISSPVVIELDRKKARQDQTLFLP